MGLLAPAFLLGALAVSLPLWLHLLQRHRSDPQPFSSLMFFEQHIQSSRKHRRLRYLLLLSFRIALLLLLVLAFASPYLNRPLTARPANKTLRVIALDRSFSMRYGNHLPLAKQIADGLINGSGTRYLTEVVALDASIEPLTQPTIDRSALLAAVDAINATDQKSSFAQWMHGFRSLEQSSGMHLDVHIISDWQKTSMPAAFADLRATPATSLTLHALGDGLRPNWAVSAVQVTPRIFDAKGISLAATVNGWQTPAARKTATLLLDGKVAGTQSIDLPPGGHKAIQFGGLVIPHGFHRGEIQIDSTDSLPADDHLRFAVERADPRPVLFTYRGNQMRAAFYYRAAIESAPNAGLTVTPAPVEQLASQDLSHYAYVVLQDDGDLDSALDQKLTSYVKGGGSLLLSVSRASKPDRRVPVTGDSIKESEHWQSAGTFENGHPAAAGLSRLANVQFYRSTGLTLSVDERVLGRFADGSPLLTELKMGNGRVLTFASTLDGSDNDFPTHASFLPFVVQSGRYLAGDDDAGADSLVAMPVAIRHPDETTSVDVIGPQGNHELDLKEQTTSTHFVPRAEGFYDVREAGRQSVVAINSDRAESDLTPVSNDTLSLWRQTGTSLPTSVKANTVVETHPVDLFRYILFLALLAAAIESVLASRYLRKGTSSA